MKTIKHDRHDHEPCHCEAGAPGYQRPRLIRLGSLADLTRGGGGTFQDASGLQDAGGSGSI